MICRSDFISRPNIVPWLKFESLRPTSNVQNHCYDFNYIWFIFVLFSDVRPRHYARNLLHSTYLLKDENVLHTKVTRDNWIHFQREWHTITVPSKLSWAFPISTTYRDQKISRTIFSVGVNKYPQKATPFIDILAFTRKKPKPSRAKKVF